MRLPGPGKLVPISIFLVATLAVTATAQKPASQIFADKAPKLVANGAGEGPAWDPQLGLLFSGNGGVNRFHDGKLEPFRAEAGTNGLLFDHQGRLLMCQPKYRRVSRLDPKTGKLTVLTDRYAGQKYNQPNDITVDSKGRIYFTDPKYGSREGMEILDAEGQKVEGVYRIDTDGTVTRIITHEVDRPNGIVVTPEDKYLYVADNNNNNVGVERKLWRFELPADGTVDASTKKMLFDWKTGRGPDGMVLDKEGRIYVAGGLNEPNLPNEAADEFKGGVYVLDPTGKLLDFVPVPNDEVTNCTFGGPDLKTLFITAGGTLWSIKTRTAGQMPWPR